MVSAIFSSLNKADLGLWDVHFLKIYIVPVLAFSNPHTEVDATGRQKGWVSTLEAFGRHTDMKMSDHQTYAYYVSKEGFTTNCYCTQ